MAWRGRAVLITASVAMLGSALTTTGTATGLPVLDSSFGVSGVVILDSDLGPVTDTREVGSDAAGRVYLGGGDGQRGCVTRLTATGAIDTAYGAAAGSWCLPAGADASVVRRLDVSAAGVATAALTIADGTRAVVRLTTTGAAQWQVTLPGALPDFDVLDVAALTDGSAAVLERTGPAGTLQVTLVDPLGTSQQTWVVPSPVGASFEPDQVLAAPQGRLYLTGPLDDGSVARYAIARVDAAGLLDVGYSGDGVSVHQQLQQQGWRHRSALMGDGVLLASQGSFDAMSLVGPDGRLERSLGGTGAGSGYLDDVVVRPDGRIWLVETDGSAWVRLHLQGSRDGSPEMLRSWQATGALRGAGAALAPQGDLILVADAKAGVDKAVRLNGDDVMVPTVPTLNGAWVALGPTSLITWSGASDASGVTSYVVSAARGTATGGLPTRSAALGSTALTRRLVSGMTPGSTVCLTVRARDYWGNVGPPGRRCTTAPLAARSLVRSSGSSLVPTRGAFGGAVVRAVRNGATISTRSVRGSAWFLVVTTCPTCGTVDLYVGRTRIVWGISTRGPLRHQVVLRAGVRAGTLEGPVSVRVRSAGRPVMIEGIAVLAGAPPYRRA